MFYTYVLQSSDDMRGYKIENGLLRLVESLERKREEGDWIDRLIVKESNVIYGNE